MLKRIITISLFLVCLFSLSFSADTKSKQAVVDNPVEQKQSTIQPTTPGTTQPQSVTPKATSPDALAIPWLSVNAGGSVNMTSTNFGLKASVGQSVIGYSTSSNFQ